MVPADLAPVMAMEQVAHVHPWTTGNFRDCLKARYCCQVLESREGLSGYGIVSLGAGEAELLNLCIAPAQQGQGLGRYLLRHLLIATKAAGAGNLFLEVRPTNATALRLYEGIGFNEAGVRPAYYPGPRGPEDAIIMAISL